MSISRLVDDLIFEDVVRKTECFGVEVEVAIRGWVIAGFASLPFDLCERRRGNTVIWIAKKIVGWRVGPQIASIWLRRVADIARLATKCKV